MSDSFGERQRGALEFLSFFGLISVDEIDIIRTGGAIDRAIDGVVVQIADVVYDENGEITVAVALGDDLDSFSIDVRGPIFSDGERYVTVSDAWDTSLHACAGRLTIEDTAT